MKQWLTGKRRAAVLGLAAALAAAAVASGKLEPVLVEPVLALARLLVGA